MTHELFGFQFTTLIIWFFLISSHISSITLLVRTLYTILSSLVLFVYIVLLLTVFWLSEFQNSVTHFVRMCLYCFTGIDWFTLLLRCVVLVLSIQLLVISIALVFLSCTNFICFVSRLFFPSSEFGLFCSLLMYYRCFNLLSSTFAFSHNLLYLTFHTIFIFATCILL